jgi:hypothetical protein
MPTPFERAAGAFAGACAIGLVYRCGRRTGLTSADLARRVAPDNALAGRAAQLAAGSLACAPAAAAGGLARGAATGLLAGLVSVGRRPSPGAALVAIVAHAIGGGVAGLVTRQLGDRRAQVGADQLRR